MSGEGKWKDLMPLLLASEENPLCYLANIDWVQGVHGLTIMLCPSEDKEVSKICPVLKVVSSVVIEIFTSNVRAKQSGHRSQE